MSLDNAADVSLSHTWARDRDRNVGDGERALSLAAAVGLAAIALRRRGIALALVAPAAVLAHRALTGRCPTYRMLGVNTASRKERGVARMERGASASVAIDRGVKLDDGVVIARPVAEVYARFRDLHCLAEMGRNVERVEVSNSSLSHWTVRGPLGVSLRWDAEVINDIPDELIAWRTREGADVRSAGSVRFTPRDGGASTEVRVQLKYDPPLGRLGAAVAKLVGGSGEDRLREDLARIKDAIESAPTPRVEVRTEYGDGRLSAVSVPPSPFPPRRIVPNP